MKCRPASTMSFLGDSCNISAGSLSPMLLHVPPRETSLFIREEGSRLTVSLVIIWFWTRIANRETLAQKGSESKSKMFMAGLALCSFHKEYQNKEE
jgi:hypothetical protein